MKNGVYTSVDPASSDGDKSCAVSYKKTKDGFEIIEILHGKPLAKWQKDLMKLAKKLGKGAVIYPRPRCRGKRSSVLEALRKGKYKKVEQPLFWADELTHLPSRLHEKDMAGKLPNDGHFHFLKMPPVN